MIPLSSICFIMCGKGLRQIELNARLFMRYFFRFKESWEKRGRKLSLGWCDRVAICKTRGGWMTLLSFALWRSILPLPRCWVPRTSAYRRFINLTSFLSSRKILETLPLWSLTPNLFLWACKKKGIFKNLWKSLFKSLRSILYWSFIHENKTRYSEFSRL